MYPNLACDQILTYNIYTDWEKTAQLGYGSSIGFGPDLTKWSLKFEKSLQKKLQKRRLVLLTVIDRQGITLSNTVIDDVWVRYLSTSDWNKGEKLFSYFFQNYLLELSWSWNCAIKIKLTDNLKFTGFKFLKFNDQVT